MEKGQRLKGTENMKDFLLFIYLVSVVVFFGGAVLFDKMLKMKLREHGKGSEKSKLLKRFAGWFFILLISLIPGLRVIAALLSLSVYVKVVQDMEYEEGQQRITIKTYGNEKPYALKDGIGLDFTDRQAMINYIGRLEDNVRSSRVV